MLIYTCYLAGYQRCFEVNQRALSTTTPATECRPNTEELLINDHQKLLERPNHQPIVGFSLLLAPRKALIWSRMIAPGHLFALQCIGRILCEQGIHKTLD